MTTLCHEIKIDAPVSKVWEVLAQPELTHVYNPGITVSKAESEEETGVGSIMYFELAAGGWMREKISDFKPNESISWEMLESSHPIKRFVSHCRIEADGEGTLLTRTVEYEMSLGLFSGMVESIAKGKWEEGAIGLMRGIKKYAEGNQ